MGRRGKRRKSVTKLKLTKSTRAFFVIIALVLFAVSSQSFVKGLFNENEEKVEKEIYNYENIYNLDYKVDIKNNNFITQESLPKGQTYISDLINTLDMDIKYEYKSSKDSNVKYDYKIDAIIGASYTDNGEEYKVWEKVYNLVEKTNQESIKDILVEQNVKIDYQKYHQEVKSFKQAMGMTVDAYLYIKLTVNTDTKVNEKDIINQYVSDFSITLGDKVANVKGETTDSNKKSLTDDVIVKNKVNILKVILDFVIVASSLYIIYYIKYKTKTAYNIRNDFKLELNRILKSCQDRIVVVKNKVELEQENTIDVRDFGELIKLSEELFKPILYWISEDNEEAWFSVISNKINYRFVLKK